MVVSASRISLFNSLGPVLNGSSLFSPDAPSRFDISELSVASSSSTSSQSSVISPTTACGEHPLFESGNGGLSSVVRLRWKARSGCRQYRTSLRCFRGDGKFTSFLGTTSPASLLLLQLLRLIGATSSYHLHRLFISTQISLSRGSLVPEWRKVSTCNRPLSVRLQRLSSLRTTPSYYHSDSLLLTSFQNEVSEDIGSS